MKHLRRICGGFLLVIALSIPAFAGETQTPPGHTETPPGVTGPQESPGVAGDISTPGVAGEMSTPGVLGDILTPGLNLLISILSLG